jgi:hypothetical protein
MSQLFILLLVFFLSPDAFAARLFTSGFELQTTTANKEWTSFTGAGTIGTTIKRSGAASYEANASNEYADIEFRAASTNPLYVRFYLYIATVPNQIVDIFHYWDAVTNPIQELMRLDSTGHLQLWNGTQQLGNSSAALSTATWYRVEFSYYDADGGYCYAFLNGKQFASGVCGNLNGGTDAYFGIIGTVTSGDLYFDDIAINDDQLPVYNSQTSLPGPGYVVHLQPNAAGDNNSWLKASGAAGDANNYTLVDETTPDDATSYIKRTATGTKIDDYKVTSSATAGIASTDTIRVIQVGARIGATSGTATNRAGIYRIKSQASGTVLSSGTTSFAVNGWDTDINAFPFVYQLTSYTDPQAGGAWTSSLINTMQIGVTNATSSTNEIRVSTLWAEVDANTSAQNPITYLQLDENAGIYSTDATGNGNNMALGDSTCTAGTGGCPSWVAGRHGSGLSFDGVAQWASIPTLDLSGTSAITVALWVKRTYGNGNVTMVEGTRNFNSYFTGFGIFPDDGVDCSTSGSIMAGIHGTGGYNTNCYAQPGDSGWHHMVFVFDRNQSTANVVRYYLDSKLQTVASQTNAADNSGTPFGNYPIYFMTRGANQQFMTGTIDEVRIYNRALTPAEIRHLFLGTDVMRYGGF